MSLTILTAADVHRLLPMADCLDVMAESMAALSAGKVEVPPRAMTRMPSVPGVFASMPGVSLDPLIMGAKVATIFPNNPAKGLASIQGCVLIFDSETGALSAVMDGAAVTSLRTAAVSGMATRLLANPDGRTHSVYGAGTLASAHIDAIKAARPSIQDVLIWGRNFDKAQALAETEAKRTGLNVRAVESAEEAAKSDIISMVTAATEPVLKGAWLNPGTHLNLVGPHAATVREADTDVITRSSVWVDLMESVMREAGEILIPISEGAFSADRLKGEIGNVVSGGISGRTSTDEITVYKSVGVVAQDLYAAKAIADRAKQTGAGAVVDF
jgi:ornithine cyclodeaminase/alanine dehydrogenase-like protein (mu-crystallin family)